MRPQAHAYGRRGIVFWLAVVATLVLVMVTVGGATRLTGSGLSITEWRPVTGAIPPLNTAAWLVEFEKYRQIPQYQLLNRGMSLADFQFIYWWEWGHRQLGRAIGALYLVGFLVVAARRLMPWRTTLVLFGMGLLLGLQGVIGWIMVASGLQEGMVAVAPVKLTLHLTFASLFLASLVAMLVNLGAFGRDRGRHHSVGWPAVLLALVFLQIALGGLVAGSKAGLTYNTWPLMDGALVPPPDVLFSHRPWLANFADNITLVQFNHRIGAYLLLVAVVWHAVASLRNFPGTAFAHRAAGLAALVAGQAVLGIVTLLLVVPLWAGLAHQAYAMIVLAFAVIHLGLTLTTETSERAFVQRAV